MGERVLVVDDQREMASMVADGLSEAGYDAELETDPAKARVRLRAGDIDALVTDLRMDGLDGLDLLATSRELDVSRPVLVMTAYGAVDTAIESIRRGAYHYLTKPFRMPELLLFLRRALNERRSQRETASLRRELEARTGRLLLGKSDAMARVRQTLSHVAESTVPVLLTGETGTGKSLAARALHAMGARAAKPFVVVNCAAIPELLVESELFGHLKGAFTGATETRPGLFLEADGGTLFLDEVGDLPVGIQAKLLHVLEESVVRPVGGTRDRTVDVRIVAATNRQLAAEVQRGDFRVDLFYRLNLVTLEIPPLRHRRTDLPELLAHFLARALERHPGARVRSLSPALVELLSRASYPGNVRELSHLIERMVLLGQSEEAQPSDLPAELSTGAATQGEMEFTGDIVPMRELQRRYARWTLEQTEGNRSRAADRLEIDRNTLARLLTDSG